MNNVVSLALLCNPPMLLTIFASAITISAATALGISNVPIVIDMVQNNPGDAVAWEQTKYFDARELYKLNYTRQTTTGEMSGTQAVDFHTMSSNGAYDYFPAGSEQRAWLDAYKAGVHAFVDRAVDAKIRPFFFVDLLVFPKEVLAVWTNATNPNTGAILWNDAGKQLTRALVAETVAEFPKVR